MGREAPTDALHFASLVVGCVVGRACDDADLIRIPHRPTHRHSPVWSPEKHPRSTKADREHYSGISGQRLIPWQRVEEAAFN